MKHRYDRVTYSNFIDRYYLDHELKLREHGYEEYLQEMDQLEKKEREGQPIDKEPENDKKDWLFIQSI